MWTLPNILTLLRLPAAALVPLAFAIWDRPVADWIAVTVFALAALTDYLDGRIARAWRQETPLGVMLDPVADKALVLTTLVALAAIAGPNWLLLIPAMVIILRETLISGVREHLGNSFRAPTSKTAKWKTTLQLVALFVLLIAGLADHMTADLYGRMSIDAYEAALAGGDDPHGVRGWVGMALWTAPLGYLLLWIAGLLTLISGWGYVGASLPYIRGAEGEKS